MIRALTVGLSLALGPPAGVQALVAPSSRPATVSAIQQLTGTLSAPSVRPYTTLYVAHRPRGQRSVPVSEDDPDPEYRSGWDQFKAVLYNTADGLKSLPDTLAPRTDDSIYDSYAERAKPAQSVPPARRLLDEFRQPTPKSENARATPWLDNIKSTVYGGFDVFQKDEAPAPRTVYNDAKPAAVKESVPGINALKASLPDLQSANPAQRVLAEWQVWNWEREQKQRQWTQVATSTASGLKRGVYFVVDNLAALPGRMSNFAERTARFLASIPVTVQRALAQVQAVPGQVEATAEKVQRKVQSDIAVTQRAMEQVQALPAQAQQKARESQQAWQKTQAGLQKTVTQAQDLTSQGKVWLGLEKPKPKPPQRPPPKEISPQEVGKAVAQAVAVGSAKGLWFVGKGAAFLAWNGAQKAVKVAMASAKEQQQTQVQKPSPPSTASSKTASFSVARAQRDAAAVASSLPASPQASASANGAMPESPVGTVEEPTNTTIKETTNIEELEKPEIKMVEDAGKDSRGFLNRIRRKNKRKDKKASRTATADEAIRDDDDYAQKKADLDREVAAALRQADEALKFYNVTSTSRSNFE